MKTLTLALFFLSTSAFAAKCEVPMKYPQCDFHHLWVGGCTEYDAGVAQFSVNGSTGTLVFEGQQTDLQCRKTGEGMQSCTGPQVSVNVSLMKVSVAVYEPHQKFTGSSLCQFGGAR